MITHELLALTVPPVYVTTPGLTGLAVTVADPPQPFATSAAPRAARLKGKVSVNATPVALMGLSLKMVIVTRELTVLSTTGFGENDLVTRSGRRTAKHCEVTLLVTFVAPEMFAAALVLAAVPGHPPSVGTAAVVTGTTMVQLAAGLTICTELTTIWVFDAA